MVWNDVCHKCGQKIFNGVPEGRDLSEYIEEMKSNGIMVGYRDRTTGFYGNTHTKKIKPICSKCSSEEIKKRNDKIVAKEMKKIIPVLKKVYVCPLCSGYSDQVFTSPNKKEMVEHIKDRHHMDLVNSGDY